MTYRQFQHKLLNYELREKNRFLHEQQTALNIMQNELKTIVSTINFQCLSNRMIRNNEKET